MAAIDLSKLNMSGLDDISGSSTQAALQTIIDNQRRLVKQLTFALENLDEDNFNDAAWDKIFTPIYAKIEDAENGLSTQLQVTAEGILLAVSQTYATNEAMQTAISVTAQGILSTVQATYATLSGVSSAISQSAGQILLTVQGYNYQTGTQVQSAINVALDGITLETVNYDGYSRLRLYRGGVLISTSGQITLGGEVIFVDDLSDGMTVISGDNIQTGSIYADYIDLDGLFTVYGEGGRHGAMGAAYGNDGTGGSTRGVFLEGRDSDFYVIVTDAGVRLQTDGTEFYCSSNRIYASEDILIGSDMRLKKDIAANMARYEDFFLALRPSYFRMNNGRSGRYHTGFIAQEVEAALTSGGLTTLDFAGLVISPEATGYSADDPFYGLRYGEFTALNTAMIQRLYQRVADLETQLAALAAIGG